MRFYFAQLIDIDLTKYGLMRGVQFVICVIKQQSSDHHNHCRADYQKDSAHECGIQQSQAEPKGHGYLKFGMNDLRVFAQDVSYTAHGMDQASFAFTLQLLTQITDIDFQHIAFTAKVVAPDAVKDHFAREYLLGVSQE